jgi:hypothetical protein
MIADPHTAASASSPTADTCSGCEIPNPTANGLSVCHTAAVACTACR